MHSREIFARFAWMRHRTLSWTADIGFIISALGDGQKLRRNVLIAKNRDCRILKFTVDSAYRNGTSIKREFY
jgi:hypothetical protein